METRGPPAWCPHLLLFPCLCLSSHRLLSRPSRSVGCHIFWCLSLSLSLRLRSAPCLRHSSRLHLSLRPSHSVGCHFAWRLDPTLLSRLRPVPPLVTPLLFSWFVALPGTSANRTDGCHIASHHCLLCVCVNPRVRTTSLCIMSLHICNFFCLPPRTHTGTPRTRTGISL